WHLAVRRTVEPVAVGGGRSRRVAAGADPMPLRWLGRRATGPRTAIAARAQRYWLADPRYAAGLIIIPLMAVLLWFTGGMAAEGGPGLGLLLILGPITAWSLAYSISADIAYDHTAFHLHVVSGVRGVDDRWGRVLGLAGWGVPMILLVTTATVAAAGDWSLLAPMLGLALGLFGTTAGLSAFVSARFVYPVPKPGDSPFATPQGAAMRTMLVQGAAMLVSLALAVPFLVPFVVRLVTGAAVWGWVTVALGLAWGAVALWLGVRLGARWYDRAQAETYQAVAAF
ncbi:Tat (twin-arginine translocation) pathway signal sequence, partial [Thiopseudomonas sp. 4R-3cl]